MKANLTSTFISKYYDFITHKGLYDNVSGKVEIVVAVGQLIAKMF